MKEPKYFGGYLRELRKAQKLTGRQLALYADVSSTYIWQIEKGHRPPPSPRILKKLAKPLDVPYEQLMEKAGHLPQEPKPKEIQPGSKEEIMSLVKESFGRYPLSEEAFEEVAEYIEFKLEEHKIQEAKKADK